MDRKTFNKFRKIVYEKSGINLTEKKDALVTARVGKRMRVLCIKDYKAYLELVLQDESGEEIVHLLDAISTNVTSFFREPKHFDFLIRVYSEWVKRGQRRFRIWSAASSAGQEPYSIVISLLANIDHANLDLKILATDISTRVLAESVTGKYTEQKIQGVPKPYLHKFFNSLQNGDQKYYQVKSDIKKLVVFRRLNLSKPPFPMRGPLDVVFCRNVMIYFDNTVRTKLLAEIYRLLKPGGYLMVGHAESLTGLDSDFKIVQPAVYVKK